MSRAKESFLPAIFVSPCPAPGRMTLKVIKAYGTADSPGVVAPLQYVQLLQRSFQTSVCRKFILSCFCLLFFNSKKLKQSRYRPGVAQRVSGI